MALASEARERYTRSSAGHKKSSKIRTTVSEVSFHTTGTISPHTLHVIPDASEARPHHAAGGGACAPGSRFLQRC
jgi:hypothetical protein